MKTAILLPTWVGDTCMATPTIRAIRQGMPEIDELCLVGRFAPVSILEGAPWADSSIVFKPKSKDSRTLSRRGMIAELKRRRFDTIILLPNSLSAGLIGYLSGAKRRIGYAKDGRSWLLTDRIGFRKDAIDVRTLPMIDYYLNIAAHLGCAIDNRAMELFVSEEDRTACQQMFAGWAFEWDRPTVVLNTASATSVARLWPVGHASRTAAILAEKHDVQVVIHCGPAERERANAIEYGAAHPRVRSMGTLADLPIGLSKAVLEKASLVVSTDSGPRHIAVALNRPTVSLFGPTGPELTRTYNMPEQSLGLSMSCRPCNRATCPLIHNNCMHGLGYAQVVNAVVDGLNQAKTAGKSSLGWESLVPGRAA